MRLDRKAKRANSNSSSIIDYWYVLMILGILLLVISIVFGCLLSKSIGWNTFDFVATPAFTGDVSIAVSTTVTVKSTIVPTSVISADIPSSTETPVLTATPIFAMPSTPTPLLTFFEGPIEYGTSAGSRHLYAYRLGTGPSARAIIGGIHGGYEWNTVQLVSDTLKYLQENTSVIPSNVTLYVIPCANPDGYAAGTDPVVGRMNDNLVDLNRNWDYNWQITATHGTRPVYAGKEPFSEPETAFLRDFILSKDTQAVVFYHSAMGVIFSGVGITQSATFQLAEMLSDATQYPHNTEGIYGQITTGDAIDWLSIQGIAGAEIELTSHALVSEEEWQRNLQGIQAFLDWTIPIRSANTETDDQYPEVFITYTVKAGDSLGDIVLEYGVDLELLMRVNEITDPHLIYPGQILKIPLLPDQ